MAGQGDVANAKDDTRYLGVDNGSGLADLAADLSQLADDLTVGTSCVHEASGSRWNPTPPLAIELAVLLDLTDTGYLFVREGVGSGLRLSVAAGGIIEARVNGTLIASVSVPSLGPSEVVIGWSMEPNVFTTSAANAIRSELRAWNVDSEEFVQTVATHATPATPATSAIWLARTTAGASAFTGSASQLRWSVGRFHPAAETREDFIEETLEPTLALATRREVPVPTRASGAGDDGHFAGPIYKAVAAGLGQADLRQAGFIVAEHYRSPETLSESFPAVRSVAALGAPEFTMLGQYFVHRPVPLPCNRLKVRVHIQAWRIDSADPDYIFIRCYSMSRPPLGLANNLGLGPQPPLVRYSREVVVESADGSGTTGGHWYTFDLLEIARDGTGLGTWLGLAFYVEDQGGGGTADQRWRVRAWTVEPGIEDTAGTLPLGGLS